MSILIENATIITMDTKNRIIRDGGCLIEGDRIVALGDNNEVRKEAHAPEHRIDARNCLLMPGLVDAHIHTNNTLSRGLVPPDVAFGEWIGKWMRPYKSLLLSRFGAVSSKLAMVEMIRSGTTCFLDSLVYSRHGFSGFVEAVVEAGLRACIAKFVTDVPRFEPMEGIGEEDTIREARSLHDKFQGAGDGRVEVWLEPPALGTTGKQLYEEVSDLAKEINAGLTIHFLEAREDREQLRKMGFVPGKLAEETGMLGERRVFAHGVWMSDEDIEVLAKSGATVAHCPTTNMKLIDGIAPVAKMLSRGLNVALGCDGFSSNDNVDIFREMRTATLLHRVVAMDPDAVTAFNALRMGTVNGAAALGKKVEIGSLEVGKKADAIVVEMRRPYYGARADPVGHAVYSCSGSDVSHVVVDGKMVMVDRKIVTLDEERIGEEAEKASMALAERLDAKIADKR